MAQFLSSYVMIIQRPASVTPGHFHKRLLLGPLVRPVSGTATVTPCCHIRLVSHPAIVTPSHCLTLGLSRPASVTPALATCGFAFMYSNRGSALGQDANRISLVGRDAMVGQTERQSVSDAVSQRQIPLLTSL